MGGYLSPCGILFLFLSGSYLDEMCKSARIADFDYRLINLSPENSGEMMGSSVPRPGREIGYCGISVCREQL